MTIKTAEQHRLTSFGGLIVDFEQIQQNIAYFELYSSTQLDEKEYNVKGHFSSDVRDLFLVTNEFIWTPTGTLSRGLFPSWYSGISC